LACALRGLLHYGGAKYFCVRLPPLPPAMPPAMPRMMRRCARRARYTASRETPIKQGNLTSRVIYALNNSSNGK